MINHVRTLILNSRAPIRATIGDEYIPTEFTPLTLPDELDAVRKVILPEGYSTYQENYALMYLLRVLHAPELVGYTTGFDPRFSYVFDDDFFDNLRQSALRTDTSHSDDSDVSMHVRHELESHRTMIKPIRWLITKDESAESSVLVTVVGGKEQSIPIKFKLGRSQTLELIHGRLHVHLTSPSDTLSGTFMFEIAYDPIPALSVVDWVSAIEGVDTRLGITSILFNDQDDELEMELLKLWRYSPEYTIRLGAVMLGYAKACTKLLG